MSEENFDNFYDLEEVPIPEGREWLVTKLVYQKSGLKTGIKNGTYEMETLKLKLKYLLQVANWTKAKVVDDPELLEKVEDIEEMLISYEIYVHEGKYIPNMTSKRVNSLVRKTYGRSFKVSEWLAKIRREKNDNLSCLDTMEKTEEESENVQLENETRLTRQSSKKSLNNFNEETDEYIPRSTKRRRLSKTRPEAISSTRTSQSIEESDPSFSFNIEEGIDSMKQANDELLERIRRIQEEKTGGKKELQERITTLEDINSQLIVKVQNLEKDLINFKNCENEMDKIKKILGEIQVEYRYMTENVMSQLIAMSVNNL